MWCLFSLPHCVCGFHLGFGLGHANVCMTIDRYLHVTESMQHEASARVDVPLDAAAAGLEVSSDQAADEV